MIRIIFRIFLIALALVALWQYKLILYGMSQARGQYKILAAAREIPEILGDQGVADSIKAKLHLISDVKGYTVDSLGFKPSRNYTTFYDQQGRPSLWVVTGARPYALEAREWDFPFLGSVPYKGFFLYDKALEEAGKLAQENWDTNIRVTGGWSTLGWFRDPVLSNMLAASEGELVNTIIHELTHENLFVKDSVAFNENLASFFGDQGAQRFLKAKFGANSEEYKSYLQNRQDSQKFTDHILRGADYLDSLYRSMPETWKEETRLNAKNRALDEIIWSCDTLKLYNKQRYIRFLGEKQINNAFFMSYLRYRGDFAFLERELNNKFKGDLRGYFQYFKDENKGL